MHKIFLFFIIFLLCHTILAQNLLHPYSVQIEDGETDCFYQHILANHPVTLMFEVSAGDDFLLRAIIRGPPDGTNEIYNHVSAEDFLSFTAQSEGEYQFCFENVLTAGAKIISFNIVNDVQEKLDVDGNPAVFNATKDPGAAVLMKSIQHISTKLVNSTRLVDQAGLYGTRQLWSARALAARVEFWNSIKSATIIIWAMVNVLSIRWMLSGANAPHGVSRRHSKVSI